MYHINFQKSIDKIFKDILSIENKGEAATYIPELAKINPDNFGVCLKTIDNKEIGKGNWKTKFSIQSISKVLTLSFAYKLLGDSIWDRIGVEPSGNTFNSLIQLETNNGIPRNPLINGGAMVICDLIISNSQNSSKDFLDFLKSITLGNNFNYSESIAKSEKSVGYRNIALCNFIKSFGNIKNHPNEVLDFYFKICSIKMTCQELANTFMFLVDENLKSRDNQAILSVNQSKRVNAIMQTCGFYDESGEFAFKVGLPGKSGVGGGIIAIYPNKYSIAVWSPKLNKRGNSYRGMKFLESFTTETELSIF